MRKKQHTPPSLVDAADAGDTEAAARITHPVHAGDAGDTEAAARVGGGVG